MFDGILSDGKSPVFFGVTMGAFVLISFVLLGTLTLDGRFHGGKSIESELREQSAIISELMRETNQHQVEYDERRSRAKETEELEKSNLNLGASIRQLTQIRSDLEAKNASMGNALEMMVSNYRTKIRSKAVGEKIEELETLSGKKYQDVTIRSVTALGIAIRHAGGAARIKADDLDESFWVRFDFNLAEIENYDSDTESLIKASNANFYSNQDEIQRSQAEIQLGQAREKLASLRKREKENHRLI